MSIASGVIFENIILEPMDMAIGPKPETPIFREAVASDTGAWEDDVAMCWSNFNGVDHLHEIHTILLCKMAPLIEECQDRSSITIFYYFAVSDSIGRSRTVRGYFSVLMTSLKN